MCRSASPWTSPANQTRAVFDRYNVVSEADLADAVTRVNGYVAGRRTHEATVTPRRQPESGQDTDNDGARDVADAGGPTVNGLNFGVRPG